MSTARMLLIRIVFALPLVGLSPLVAQDPESASAGPWITLFDGGEPAAWRSFRGEAFPAKGWIVEDAALKVQKGGGGGDIVTREEFEDFELRFEWKVSPGANSGVMYRVGEEADAPWRTGPEYQILDDAQHPDGKDPKTSAASLYALIAGEAREPRPVGEWNEGRIVARGGRVEHWLNGRRVLAYDWAGDDLAARIAASKFASMKGFAGRRSGRIALQDHGDDVWYRHVRIRRFTKGPEVLLFDGKGFAGLTCHLQDGGKLEEVWSVTPEGVLVCKGKPTGYIRTEADWKDFILHVDWRFNPETKAEGNSGVLIRQTGPDKVWPRCLEAQLQSRSAGDFWKIDGFGLQTDPERTRGGNVRKLAMAEAPPGEWNHYEIEAEGGDVELRINGRVVNFGRDADPVAGKIALQSEGVEIQFRNWSLIPIRN